MVSPYNPLLLLSFKVTPFVLYDVFNLFYTILKNIIQCTNFYDKVVCRGVK